MTDDPGEPGAGPGLELTGVHASHGSVDVLHGVDLAVDRGELLVVLGPSGAGKSTLLRVVAGLQAASRGRVTIAGRDVTGWRPGRRNVSMVFQSYALFPHLTVAANIAFGLVVRDTSKRTAAERARAAAAVAGCEHLLDRYPAQLSGGEQQRVALARALVREPDVLLLDEPLSNLDAALRVATRTELRALHERVGGTVLHVTHDQTEALVLGDRIAVLEAGRIQQVGTPEEIWTRPATTFVARFVGSPPMNLVPVEVALRLLDRAPARSLDPSLTVGFRPAAVVLGATGPEVTVDRVELVGEDAYVHLSLDGHAVLARVPSADRPKPGSTVTIAVRPRDVHLFDGTTGRRVEP